MKQPSKGTIDYYLLPNKILCSALGMWPPDKEISPIRKIVACFQFMFSVISVHVLVVPEIMLLVIKWNDLKIFAGVGCITMSLSQILFKLCYLTARRNKAYRLYKELRSLWYLTDDPVERQSYEAFAHWARTCTITFSLSCFGTIITFFTAATYDYIMDDNNGTAGSSRHLPYDIWHGIDFIKSPAFEIIFVCQMVASVVCVLALSGLDASCMTIILHLSGQFRLIARWLSNIGIENHNSPPNVATDLIRCIRHHQRLIRVVKDVNSLLTPIIFIQILTSSIVFCLGGYAILSNSAAGDVLKFSSYILSMIIQLFLWCWPAEILIQESMEIGYSVYLNIPWYRLPPIYRRQLCLIVLRSQNYCSISAFFFHSLSMSTLANVLNTAFSYFALLRQVQDKST